MGQSQHAQDARPGAEQRWQRPARAAGRRAPPSRSRPHRQQPLPPGGPGPECRQQPPRRQARRPAQARAGSAAQRAAPSIPLQASAAPAAPGCTAPAPPPRTPPPRGSTAFQRQVSQCRCHSGPGEQGAKARFFGREAPQCQPQQPRQQGVRRAEQRQLRPAAGAQRKAQAHGGQRTAARQHSGQESARPDPSHSHRSPSAHSKQTLRSDSAPKPCSSTPSAAPAALGAKQSSARPSTRPSPKGISAPYSTAQPPANPRATAPSRRTAGRNTARASSAGAPLRRAFTVKTLVRSVIQNSPLSGGAFWFCSPHCVHIL